MPMYHQGFGSLIAPNTGENSSGSLTWRFPDAVIIQAHAALTSYRPGEPKKITVLGVGFKFNPFGEVGFISYVRAGGFYKISDNDWSPVFSMNDITQLDVGIRNFNSYAKGVAIFTLWTPSATQVRPPKVSGHTAVVVLDDAGTVVHTHEEIDFDHPAPRSEDDRFAAALDVARRVHKDPAAPYIPQHATPAELERLRPAGPGP